MGKPHCVKTENDPIYTSSSFDKFCNQWGIILTHGIPHNPILVARAHHTLKMCLLKEKQKGNIILLMLVMILILPCSQQGLLMYSMKIMSIVGPLSWIRTFPLRNPYQRFR